MPIVHPAPIEIEIELAAPAGVAVEIRRTLPELEKHLAKTWPVAEVGFAYKNPIVTPPHPDFYVLIALAGAKGTAEIAAALLVRDAYEWLKKRFKQMKKVKPSERRRRAKKAVPRKRARSKK